MVGFEQDQAVSRQAGKRDQGELRKLLERKSFIHRHLGWHSPLIWLGSQPFFVLESREGTLLAALACPPDEEGLIWLRLFAAAPGTAVPWAWQTLWSLTRDWLVDQDSGVEVYSLAVAPEMERLLTTADFEEISQVQTLVWTPGCARWPSVREDLEVRPMAAEDLVQVAEIDRKAFLPLWQNTLSQLRAAFSGSFYCSVAELDGRIVGYQISSANPQGGHLARLAVDPALQRQGVAIRLLDDLLENCLAAGFVEVSVNTQIENQPSLALYRKFGFEELPDTYPVLRWTAGDKA